MRRVLQRGRRRIVSEVGGRIGKKRRRSK